VFLLDFPSQLITFFHVITGTGAGVVVDVVVSVIAGPVLVSDGAKTKQHMYPI